MAMRTTIRLDERLLRQAKTIAAETGRTLTSVIEEALRENLARHGKAPRRAPAPLPRHRGRLQPGVDLDDSAALLDLMEKG
ncbi:MAG: type II toxin-antitoxin system VapB family antitoxin [Acidobacteria bacterium]|nr:type II toxin-antitoxin system VapB family antitoxin [Acidobacteriota bacterium]